MTRPTTPLIQIGGLVLSLLFVVLGGACPGDTGGELVALEDPLDLGAGYVDREISGELTLHNDGDADVELRSLAFSDDANTRFRFRSGNNLPLPRTLVPADTFVIEVVFLAPDVGVFYGAVRAVWAEVGDEDDMTLEVVVSAASVDNEDDDADGDGYTEADGDCNDHHPEVYPCAEERCDGEDNDCDGDLPSDEADDDGDGWRVCGGDCDDGNATRYPGADELCNGVDDDCDGTATSDEVDNDGDGVMVCDDDCNDLVPEIYPGAVEICDGLDNDCDGTEDNEGADGCDVWYADVDGDLYGDPDDSVCLCARDEPYTASNDADCYDDNDLARPTSTGWYTTHRGDGSFDYNCDTVDEQRLMAQISCSSYQICAPLDPTDCIVYCTLNNQGWSTTAPACGALGYWVTACIPDQNSQSCVYDGATETQQCR